MDEFEQFLKQQPIRRVPADWRRDILAAAVAPAKRPSWWQQWLWPSPLAWGLVAAVWLVIIGFNCAAQPSNRQIAKQEPESVREIAVALAEKRKLLDEFTGSHTAPAQRQIDHGPHSELSGDFSGIRYV